MGQPLDSKSKKAQAKRKYIPNVTSVFNLANQTCMAYALCRVGDAGMQETEWTSYRLKKEALYLESKQHRYELLRCLTSKTPYDSYKFSRLCNKPSFSISLEKPEGGKRQIKTSVKTGSVPCKDEEVEVLSDGLDWEEVEWGPDCIRVRGTKYSISVMQFLPLDSVPEST